MFPLVLAGLSQHSNELITLKEKQLLLKPSDNCILDQAYEDRLV